jgi:hypothetical protein
LGDFYSFNSDFMHLANRSGQSKEDIHDNICSNLRTRMEIFVTDDSYCFESYGQKAQHFTRRLERAGKERREAAANKKQSKETSSKNRSSGNSNNNTAP